jgi:FtsP/CotA-like multicopper oxidase with cupredoxin domain
VLKRGEPVEITLVNNLPEATAIHWHGMELDSYYDGVHGFGGMGLRVTPLVEPGDSFVVRFTPPGRAPSCTTRTFTTIGN